ncbi:golgin subfamily A member 6-like protein 25 [Prorops nasuta]|uniref:golgin subfamily A member 6-like protein 25 n=1 Tax=Prorops nasuta TaxID=863751 RepID=UPI0034D018DE
MCNDSFRNFGLPPIEEECESLTSSKNTREFSGSETEENYQTSVSLCEEYRKAIEDLENKRNRHSNEIRMKKEKNALIESSSDNDVTARDDFREKTKKGLCDQMKSVPEARGDNDDVQLSPRDKKLLWASLDMIRGKLAETHMEIVSIKQQLNIDKFRYRQCILRHHEKCLKTQENFKRNFRLWVGNVEQRMKTQMGKWRVNERKWMNGEIGKLAEIYAQENMKDLRRMTKEWRTEDSRRTSELMMKERQRQEVEAENLKKVYEKLQEHLQILEGRNKNSYVRFRQQMDAWEQRLKDEVVKLHESTVKDFRKHVKAWSRDPSEWRGEAEHVVVVGNKDQAFQEKDRCCSFGENGTMDFRRIVQVLKPELEAQREQLVEMIERKIGEVWMAFEEFKQNFHLNLAYQGNDYFGIQEALALESLESDMLTESEDATKTAAVSATKNRLSNENKIGCKCSSPDRTRYSSKPTRVIADSSAFQIENDEIDN